MLWEKGTKPWEYNGGHVYPEDLNAYISMVEQHASGEAHRNKKAERKAARRHR